MNINTVSGEFTDLYVFRHGETNSNIANVISGGGDTEAHLTEEGIKQAANLGKKIAEKGIKLEVVYTSDLQRTVDTATLAMKGYNSESPPQIVPAPQLREILHGRYELTPAAERNARARSLFEREITHLEDQIEAGSHDRHHFWKKHPIDNTIVSNENSPVRKIDPHSNEPVDIPETVYELYLRVKEEFARIAEEGHENGMSSIGISTHNAVIATLIDAQKHRAGKVFFPPFYLAEANGKDGKPLMPNPTKVANTALAHFRFDHQTKELTFHEFVLN